MFNKLFSFEKKSKTRSVKNSGLLSFNNYDFKDYKTKDYQQEGYEKNVIVFRCVKLIAENLSKIDFKLFKNGELIDNHPILDLLKNPNPYQSKKEFIQDVISQKLITGNAYIESVYNDSSNEYQEKPPLFLYSVNPYFVTVKPGKDGLPASYIFGLNENKTIFTVNLNGKSNILHLKEFSPTNELIGTSPLKACAPDVDIISEGKKWNYNIIKNGGKVSGVLEAEQELSDAQYQQLKKFKDSMIGGNNNGGIPILGGGVKFTPIGLSPSDLDFISGIKASSQMIAFAYGVPYDLVNTDQAKYENLEKAYELLWDQAIEPNLIHLLDELNNWLVPRYGEDLLLTYDKNNIGAIQLKNNRKITALESVSFMTINEKRLSIGLEPIDGGDQLLTELNKIPLSDIGLNIDADSENKSDYILSLQKKGYEKKQAEKMAGLIYDDIEE